MCTQFKLRAQIFSTRLRQSTEFDILCSLHTMPGEVKNYKASSISTWNCHVYIWPSVLLTTAENMQLCIYYTREWVERCTTFSLSLTRSPPLPTLQPHPTRVPSRVAPTSPSEENTSALVASTMSPWPTVSAGFMRSGASRRCILPATRNEFRIHQQSSL